MARAAAVPAAARVWGQAVVCAGCCVVYRVTALSNVVAEREMRLRDREMRDIQFLALLKMRLGAPILFIGSNLRQ